MTYWKTIPDDFISHGHKWAMKKWDKVDGDIKCCHNGFHCSRTIFDAAGYITPGWVCEVEVRGDSDDQGDKLAFREMRILRRKKMTKTNARKIAIYAAELVLPIYEKEYPNDLRPRNAIKASKKYLRGEITKDELDAASDAARDAARDAAWAAARDAARAAAWAAASDAARAAAWAAASDAARAAARDAARAAAWAAASDAARDAAWAAARAAAWDAASDAARDKMIAKIEAYIKLLLFGEAK